MTVDQPKPPLDEGLKNSKFKAFMNARDHSKFGHFAVVFALLSPFVALLWLQVLMLIFMFIETPKGTEYYKHIINIILVSIPALVYIVLGIMSILFGIKERRKWLITEGIVAVIVGVPLSLIWYWHWLFK